MLIESHDRFDDVAHYEPDSGQFAEFSRTEAHEEQLTELIHGHYARLADKLVVFYRSAGFLWLRIGEHVRRLGDGSTVRWERSDGMSRLSLLDEGEEVTAIEYPSPPRGTGLMNDPTPFAEPEDWDFGLFVQHVLEEDGRRGRIYTGEVRA